MATTSLRKFLGAVVIFTILALTTGAAFYPDVTVPQSTVEALIGLSGTLLVLDTARNIVVEYEGKNGTGREFSLEIGGDDENGDS